MIKIYFVTLILLIPLSIFSQSVKYGTLSFSGSEISFNSFKGGFTVGEVGVKSNIGSVKYLEGFQFIGLSDPYPECLIVTSVLPDGEGSFREAIDCALSGDNIGFDNSLSGQFLFFDAPEIEINKNLSIINDTGGNIFFRNINVNNTSTLLRFNANISVEGIELRGLNNGLRIAIASGAIVTWD